MNPRENDPMSLKGLLVPAPDDLLLTQATSQLVNSVKNEGPELLQADGGRLAATRAHKGKRTAVLFSRLAASQISLAGATELFRYLSFCVLPNASSSPRTGAFYQL
jgi:hypothetical protein